MAFIVRFVDKIATSPTTRLDLMAAPWSVMTRGTDVSPPELDRAMVSTLLTDGVRVPAAAYGHRILKLQLMLAATSFEAAQTAYQALARELDRPTNILMWQPNGASSPVFFRTFRTDAGAVGEFLDWAAKKTITISILAEPFAYGQRVDLSPVTVYNDPAPKTTLITETFESATPVVTITNGGNLPWARDNSTAGVGTWSFKAGAITHSQTSDAIITVPTGATHVRFYYRVGSEATFDKLALIIGGNTKFTASGTVAWTQTGPYAIGGASTITFRYSKDASTSTAPDTAWIDNVEFLQSVGNGMYLDVTGVSGDVETPALIRFAGQTGGDWTAIATRRRGTPANAPFVLQAESMTVGTDTTLIGPDSRFSGADNNVAYTTFATSAGMTTRLSIANWPAVGGTDVRGTYRVFVRTLRMDGSASPNGSVAMRMRWGIAGNVLTGSTLSYWNASWVDCTLQDLGLITLPLTMDPVTEGPSGVEIPVSGLPNFEFQAQRLSGTDGLKIDYFLFVPADDRYLAIDWPWGHQSATTTVDGYQEMAYPRDGSGNLYSGASPQTVVGGFPLLSPNATNRLYYLLHVAEIDSITETTAVSVSYWPRYLYVRPAAS